MNVLTAASTASATDVLSLLSDQHVEYFDKTLAEMEKGHCIVKGCKNTLGIIQTGNPLPAMLKGERLDGNDIFFTPNVRTTRTGRGSFISRRKEYFTFICGLALDCDFYKNEAMADWSPQLCWDIVEKHLEKTAGREALPNVRIHSGGSEGGLQLLWAVQPEAVTHRKLLRSERQYIALRQKLLDLLKDFEADSKHGALNNLCRLPGSTNSKYGRQVEAYIVHEDIFNLFSLADSFDCKVSPQKPVDRHKRLYLPKPTVSTPQRCYARKKVSGRPKSALKSDQVEDLLKLVNYRRPGRKQNRHDYLVLVARIFAEHDNCSEYLCELNDCFAVPYHPGYLIRLRAKIQRYCEKNPSFTHVKASYVINLLGISQVEQKILSMNYFICGEYKKTRAEAIEGRKLERRKATRRDGQGMTRRQRAYQEQIARVQELRARGITSPARIAEVIECTKRHAIRLLKGVT